MDALQLLAILDRIGGGIVALDDEWRYTYVNELAAKILQRHDPSDLIGKHIWTEYPETVGRPLHRAYLEAFETQTAIVFEEYSASRDRWFEHRVFPAPDGLTIHFSETETRKKASIALRQAAAVFANTRDSVVITDAASLVTSVNPACVERSGFTEPEILGRHVSLLFDTDVNDGDRGRLEIEKSWSGDLAGMRKDGTSFPQSVSKETLFDDRGHEEGHILICSDLTDLESRIVVEQQLAQAQKMEAIGNLTGGIAHDFNNLLAAILGNLEMIRDEMIRPDGVSKSIHRIDATIEAAARGADLTRSMLGFARRAPLTPKPLQINDIVERTRTWIERTIRSNIRFDTVLREGLPAVEADEGATQSALLNLILNARDAMPSGGTLTIETANVRVGNRSAQEPGNDLAPGQYVRLTVADTGIGIAPDILERIFEPFFSTKAPGSGSGLGLSMIKGFMKRSGGSVQVRSEAGRGTEFDLYFKACHTSRPIRTTELAAREHDSSGRRHVLLAEDDEAVRSLIAEFLQTAGYQVTPTGSAEDAMQAFRTDPSIDLLLTDVAMPGPLQGPTLARKLREMSPELPAVFISGYASKATIEGEGEGIRHDDIRLMKPFRRQELVAAVGRALAESPNGIARP